ncbi:Rec8 like protein-domain-containing protein [Leucosporidium creatinivorum]|uniref:Rec8 like protein-domain-containing protein n=1 Tax=Leucosporidium creatinivorum TaxID=106004 RepID=A0A1Y2FVL7_9BASI|nr:Rec8 like protein-domain-containing protein [Leucosporidium creatinivorum]
MFYSTDILASRKSGFGVYWLAATVGSKGGTSIKKLTRKEVLACDLVTACKQLASPEEPLALRLSSNLLCGIARVYQQQYIIYQSDVTQVHQSLKKAFNDVFKNPLAASSIDLAPVPAAGANTTAGGAHGIDLAIDPALAVLGWDPDWNVGPDWGAITRGEGVVAGVGEESEFGSGVGGTPESPRVRATVSDKHVVKDLASITLQEPHLDDYRLQDYDDPARRYQEGYDDGGFGGEPLVFGENDPGILEGHSREVDEMLGVKPRGEGGASSSAQGGDYGQFGEDLGGMDDFVIREDYGGEGFEIPAHLMGLEGDESHEDRVRREQQEAAAQRAGQAPGPRASSVEQPQPNLLEDGSPAGTLASSNKRKTSEGAAAPATDAKKPKKSPKKVKPITIDSSISLTDEQVVQARASYPERMRKEREKAAAAKEEKEGAQRAMDLIFGPPEGFGGALAEFWNDTVTSQLTRPGESRAAKEKKRKSPSKDDKQSAAKKRKTSDGAVVEGGEGEAQVGRSGEWGMFGEEGADFRWQEEMGGGEQGAYGQDQDLGGMEEQIRFDDIEEAGRAGSGTQGRGKESFPWNNEAVSSDQGAGFGALGGASSQAGTARLSRDTPLKTGLKHRSRSASLVPSALGSGRAGSQGIDAGAGEAGELEEFEIEGEQVDSQGASQPNPEAIAYKLEQDSLKFLSFAQRIASAQPSEDLLFSDIVPVASTSNSAAAAAFYHLLALSTRGNVHVEQEEPYGEITVQFAVED